MLEHISEKNGVLLAVIVRHGYSGHGIHFFTPDDFSQQLGHMNHPRGKVIAPHVHNIVARHVTYTQEVLIIRRGALRIDFYDQDRNYLESRVLRQGDIILLAAGGHGFEVIEDVDMIEIKQGPYAGESDKTRFEPVGADRIRLPE